MGLFSLHLLKENAVFSPAHPLLAHAAALIVSTDWIIFLNLQTLHKVTLLRIQISAVCNMITQIISN